MKNAWRVAVAMFFACFTISEFTFAQSDLGTISGFVKDPSGATIANAKVTIRNNRGVEREATSNDSGYYAITNVPPGFYSIVAEAPGFRRYESKDDKLDPSANLAVDFALTGGPATQPIQLPPSPLPFQTASSPFP